MTMLDSELRLPVQNRAVDINEPWDLVYKKVDEAQPSWAKHGMPPLYSNFLAMARIAELPLRGVHADFGCGSCVKTIVMAQDGFDVMGIDQSGREFPNATRQIEQLGLASKCRLLQMDCRDTGLVNGAVSSATDILMGTHLPDAMWDEYIAELQRVMQPGSLMLWVLFSESDKHFHGHPVERTYYFDFAKVDRTLEPEADKYLDYQNMFNRHFNEEDIRERIGRHFQIVGLGEYQHPIYSHRKLWNVITAVSGHSSNGLAGKR